MVNTHDLELRVLSLGMRSELETIKEYSSDEYIPNRGFSTIRAYTNKSGRDVKSLKKRIIKLQGCELPNEFRPKALFDYRNKIVRVVLDLSKIQPLSNSGYIVFELSGNYGFNQLIKLPWTINKTPLKFKNDWIKIQNLNEPVTWITGDVSVAKISFVLPDDIKDNKIWYQIITPSIDFFGQDSRSYKIKSDTELTYEVEYDVLYSCNDSLESPKEKNIKVGFEDAMQGDNLQVLSVKFIPAIRHITAKIENCTETYTLGSSDTELAKLTLVNKCQDVHANAKVKVGIKSMIGEINCVDLISSDESTACVKANQTRLLMFRINSERLKQLPENDVDVTITVEGNDPYTEVEFSESFKLKV